MSEELCFLCNAEPGGKWGIGEKCASERFSIYDLKPSPTKPGGVDFTLSHAHRQLIKFLGSHGGETFYEWSKVTRTDDESLRLEHRTYGEPFPAHMKRLIANRFVRETPIIGQTRVLLRLTDWGWKVYEQIKDRVEVFGVNTAPPKG